MEQSVAKRHSAGSIPVTIEPNRSGAKRGWVVALAAVLGLLLLAQGLDAKWQDPPLGQPAQMRSQVKYDPKLFDPFFEKEEWGCPMEVRDCDNKDLLRKTAKLWTDWQVPGWISYCDAKQLDSGKLELFFHQYPRSPLHRLKMIVQKGKCWSQFWTLYEAGPTMGLSWTTTTQELTLDKRVYGKGDEIRGRIVFECLDEFKISGYGQRPPRVIKIEGVFKTIVE